MAIIGEKITLDKPLVGNIARNQMESKMELTTKGALYVGTGKANSVTPDGGGTAVPIPITSHIAPNGASDNGKVLVADSKETVGWKISDTCPKATTVTTNIGTQKITDIFESNGKTAKSATIAKGLQSNTAQTTNGTNWYEFNGTNEYFGSTNSPTIIKTSEARPKAEVKSGGTTVTKEIALLEDIPSAGEWVDVVSTSYEDKSLVRKFVFPDLSGDLEGKSVEVVYEPKTYGAYTRVLSFGVISLPKGGTATDTQRTVSGFYLRTGTEETETNPVSCYIQINFKYVSSSSIQVTAFTSLKGDDQPTIKYRKIK